MTSFLIGPNIHEILYLEGEKRLFSKFYSIKMFHFSRVIKAGGPLICKVGGKPDVLVGIASDINTNEGGKYLDFSPLIPSKREKNLLVLSSSFSQLVYFLREVCLLFNF